MNRKQKKRFIPILIMAIILQPLLFFAIYKEVTFFLPSSSSKADTIGQPENVISYMNEKYGEDFETVWPAPHKLYNKFDDLTCYVKGTSKRTDHCTVRLEYDESTKKYHYIDNYVGIQIRDDYENFIKSIISKYSDNYILFSNVSSSDYFSDYDKNTTLEDVLKNKDINDDFKVAFSCDKKDEEKFKKIVTDIYNELLNKKLVGTFSFYFMEPQEIKNVTRSNCDDLLSKDSHYCYYSEYKNIYIKDIEGM